jgi:hypothetical protein
LINERFGPNSNDGEEEEDDDDEGIDAYDDDNIIGNGDAVASIFRAHIVDNTRRGYQREQKKLAFRIFKQVSNQSQRTSLLNAKDSVGTDGAVGVMKRRRTENNFWGNKEMRRNERIQEYVTLSTSYSVHVTVVHSHEVMSHA